MTMTLDRNSPQMREAIDQAARAAEWLLDRRNDHAAQELALDILNDFVGGIAVYGVMKTEATCHQWLAWAFSLTEGRTDLKPHEEKLLDLAWEKVREDALQRKWEALGGAR